LQQPGRLVLGGADDLLGLLARLRDDPVALLIDAPGLLHLFRDRDAKLVDEVEHRGLLEHDVVRHRDLSRIDDERFEALDEELDVYVILPQRAESTPDRKSTRLNSSHGS